MASSSQVREPLRVAIDARFRSGGSGGVETVTLGLAQGLSMLGGPEQYLFLTLAGDDEWLRPHLGGTAHAIPTGHATDRLMRQGRRAVRRSVPGAAAVYQRLRGGHAAVASKPPDSDGTAERHGAHVVHLVRQAGFRTTLPSIYHPHDLQHRHLPELFTPEAHAFRENWYTELAQRATIVAVASTWTKRDVVAGLHLPESKVVVVPWAPPLGGIKPSDISTVRERLRLPRDFVYYPAQTWPHKNHIGLVRAVSRIRRERGLSIPLVFSGLRNSTAVDVDRAIRSEGVRDLVKWTGFLDPADVAAIYRVARAVVIPSRFEAASGPLWEAFEAGVPAACAAVTSLPEQAGDAALLFDPSDVGAIAEAVIRLWNEPELRDELVARGRRQVARFTWDRTARHFRALYRSIAGYPLTVEDQTLLAEPPGI